jgi:hypothetical protein
MLSFSDAISRVFRACFSGAMVPHVGGPEFADKLLLPLEVRTSLPEEILKSV